MDQNSQSPPEKKGYLIYVIVRKIIVYLLCIAIVVGAILFASSRTPDKSLFGYSYYTVITPSMTPAYKVGDMVFVQITDADDIAVGDVITFNPSGDSEAYLTHRVTEKLTNYEGTGVTCFRTKGDANDSEDAFLIDEARVIGRVKFGVPKLGYIVRFVQLRWYFILPILLLIGVMLRLLRAYFADDEENAEDEADSGSNPTESQADAAKIQEKE